MAYKVLSISLVAKFKAEKPLLYALVNSLTTQSKVTEMATAKEWEKQILARLELKAGSLVTEVNQSTVITDVRVLFGQDLKGKVWLRTSEDHQQGRPIRLIQFQPNFHPGNVICRHPACKNVNPEGKTRKGKRDLYLCPRHLMKLGDFIKEMCTRKKAKLIILINFYRMLTLYEIARIKFRGPNEALKI